MKKEKPDHYRSIDDLNENKKLMKQFGGRQIPEEIRNFDVVLQDPNHVYFSGDTIHGKVLVELDGCVTVQGIIVRLVGEAYVNVPEESGQWEQLRRVTRLRRNKISPSSIPESLCEDPYPETPEDDCCKQWGKNPPAPSLQRPRRARNTKKERQAAKFRSYEKYFEHKLFVFGHKYSSQREQLWAGSHCFPFDYTLPTKLPASFHGRFGYVRYFCEASLERSTSPSICCRAYFSVSCIADVNTDPKAESGASEQKSTNSFLFCCRKGTVIVSASIKRRGFVPGEEVLVSADILNMSNRPVRRSCAKLRQVVTYFSNKGFRNYVSEGSVSEASRGPVPIGESDTWYRVRLPVPSIPPTSRFTNCCKLMDIDYRLNFVVEMVGEPEPLEIHLPLVIGTVPLHKRFPYLMTSQALEELGTRTQRMPGAVHVKFSDLPGLMSEQCVWGPRPVETYYSQQVFRGKDPATVGLSGSRSRTRDKIFAPRYVVYRLGRQDKYDGQGDLVIKSAIEIPQIIITRPGAGVCYRHHHVKKGPERRHSAPGHLVVLRAEHPLEHVPLEPLTDIPEVRETHKTSPYKVLC